MTSGKISLVLTIQPVLRHRRCIFFGSICLTLWFYVCGPTTLRSWIMLACSLVAMILFLFIARAYIAPYSRVSPVIYVSGPLVFAQFAVCISVEVIVRGTWNVLGTPTAHLGRASPEDLCSIFRVSELRLNSYRMTSTFRLGIGADLPWWTCHHPPHWLCIMVHHVKCILGL